MVNIDDVIKIGDKYYLISDVQKQLDVRVGSYSEEDISGDLE